MILTSATPNALVMEGNEIVKGWPLGLGNINSVVGTSQPASASRLRLRLRRRSSFSSFSSSNLDTESTASFFPDQSVPLGRLIGIRPISSKKLVQSENEGNVGEAEDPHGGAQPRISSICSRLLQHVIARILPRPKHLPHAAAFSLINSTYI